MNRFFNFVKKEDNRKLLTWLGGGLVVLLSGIWAVFIHFENTDSKKDPKNNVSSSCGSSAVGGNVSNSTINSANSGICQENNNNN